MIWEPHPFGGVYRHPSPARDHILAVTVSSTLMHNDPPPGDAPRAPDGVVDWWELPLWIAELQYGLEIPIDVMVVRDANAAVNYLANLPPGAQVCASVLYATWPILRTLLLRSVAKGGPAWALGGYALPLVMWTQGIDTPVSFVWFKSIDELRQYYRPLAHSLLTEGADYTVFEGMRCVPRLRLSRGCKYACAFCDPDAIPHGKVEAVHPLSIAECITSICSQLKFSNVYLDDKTLGQCPNVEHFPKYAAMIRKHTPDFQGFIGQTACPDAPKLTSEVLNEFTTIELGIESFNNSILRAMHKPCTEKQIMWAVDHLTLEGVNVIPNIMVGYPGETLASYQRTLDFLRRECLITVNRTWVSAYPGTRLWAEHGCSFEDCNQSKYARRSWMSPSDYSTALWMWEELGSLQ